MTATPTAAPPAPARRKPIIYLEPGREHHFRPDAWEDEVSPSRYIMKVRRATRQEIPGPIRPEELLVHHHRDRHPLDVAAQIVASRLVEMGGREAAIERGLARLNALGRRLAERVGEATGSKLATRRLKGLLGIADRGYFFQFREQSHLTDREVKQRIEAQRAEARARLHARGRWPKLHVLLTGATGFLGKEFVAQAARDPRIARVVCVARPEALRDPRTREVVRILSPEQRGKLLLKRLHVDPRSARKFRFIDGDIEKPLCGIEKEELERLKKAITNVIHCAASVSFDAPYEESYKANVLGCLNALELSQALQRAKGSPFIHHIAIETSYIHGRKKRSIAQESALAFPRAYYNNYYELTKAMASIETDRALVEKGLRVVQLLPSIVIGHSRTGCNRGDTKVVNAPVNAFGRAREATRAVGSLAQRSKAKVLSRVALSFPGNRRAEINLVPVDRVVQGMLHALVAPEAIGERVHLATDNRIRSKDMVRIVREEIGIDVRLVDPTLFRNLTLPVLRRMLAVMNEPRIANALEKLSTIFGSYGEWGQPIHDVGNDVRILKLPLRRPDTQEAFRMLVRHNEFVQQFGRVRDPDEIARREQAWEKVVEAIEYKTGRAASSIPAREFRRLLQADELFMGSLQNRGQDSLGREKPSK